MTQRTTGILTDKLDDLLVRAQREIDAGLLPSCQIAVAMNGELVAFETFGDADNDTPYSIMSCTKAIVCSAFWLLLGEGSVRLEQRVAEITPEFGANSKNNVTVEHVLTHSAGFPDATLNPFHWEDRSKRLETFASWTLDWEPGTAFRYHGLSGHWVLAEIIEQVTGADFRDFVRTRVVEPLALRHFVLGGRRAADAKVAPLEIVGTPVESKEHGAPDHRRLTWLSDPEVRATGIPAGAGISTAADLAMFYQALLRNEPPLWNPSVLTDATSHIRNAHVDPTRGFAQNYGLGVRIASDDGYGVARGLANRPHVFGHDGAGGMLAFADPDTGLSFSYLTNGLDDDLVRQWKRTAGLSHRAVAVAAN